ncbi:MAG TPA: peptidylprolyl isomerase [Anaerolineales bacterium]
MAKQNTPRTITKKHIARLERERRQVNLIRGIAIAGIVIVAGLLIYGYLRLNVFALREPVAEVNGVTITTGEWQQRVKYQRALMVNAYNEYSFYQQNFGFDYSQQLQQIASTLSVPEILGQQVLDQMVEEILIRQAAEEMGISVSEEELEQSIQETFGFFPDGTPSPTVTPTEVTFPTLTSQQLTLYPSTFTPTAVGTFTVTPTATLDPSSTAAPTSTPVPATPTPVPENATATATPYTLEGFQSEFNKTVESFGQFGISEQTIRTIFENTLLRQKVMAEVTQDVPRTEEQVWARHILVGTEAEANAALDLINQGTDFATVAQRYSEDTGSGANGGDLGWFGRGAMVPEFEQVAFNLEVGEISEPVQSSFGYHIIQVLGHNDVPLDNTQYEQKKETEFSNWLAVERGQAEITTYETWREHVPTEPELPAQLLPQ